MSRPEEKRLLRRPRKRWENIKLDCQAVECKSAKWILMVHSVLQWQAVRHPFVSVKHAVTTHITVISVTDGAQQKGRTFEI